jgi:hypothetical protein
MITIGTLLLDVIEDGGGEVADAEGGEMEDEATQMLMLDTTAMIIAENLSITMFRVKMPLQGETRR